MECYSKTPGFLFLHGNIKSAHYLPINPNTIPNHGLCIDMHMQSYLGSTDAEDSFRFPQTLDTLPYYCLKCANCFKPQRYYHDVLCATPRRQRERPCSRPGVFIITPDTRNIFVPARARRPLDASLWFAYCVALHRLVVWPSGVLKNPGV